MPWTSGHWRRWPAGPHLSPVVDRHGHRATQLSDATASVPHCRGAACARGRDGAGPAPRGHGVPRVHAWRGAPCPVPSRSAYSGRDEEGGACPGSGALLCLPVQQLPPCALSERSGDWRHRHGVLGRLPAPGGPHRHRGRFGCPRAEGSARGSLLHRGGIGLPRGGAFLRREPRVRLCLLRAGRRCSA